MTPIYPRRFKTTDCTREPKNRAWCHSALVTIGESGLHNIRRAELLHTALLGKDTGIISFKFILNL